MHVSMFMAMSLDGYIADVQGGEDFLSHDNWLTLTSLVRENGSLIWGRRTCEAVQNWDESYLSAEFTNAAKIVLTRRKHYQSAPGFTAVSTPENALAFLSAGGIETALVSGGSSTNGAFLSAGLVDELILNIEPVLLGGGIPLIDRLAESISLKFVSSKAIKNGILQLRYRVDAKH
ncbi:MAG TPA: dihydrofolate reductase family protein [bacterium]|nr:dihydrofolate reductase family protein [bacterium]